MSIRVGVNGFGRIGRVFFRTALNDKEIEVVGVNDLADAKTLAHLLKHDSVHGQLQAEGGAKDGAIFVDGREIRVTPAKDPAPLPSRAPGAATAVGLVLPKLKGKLDGISIRVPTANVSVVDLVAELGKPATAQAVNDAFREAAAGALRGILEACEEELVSADFNGNPHSSIVDLPSTAVIEGNLLKVLAWYDNEWGYSSRLRDLVRFIGKTL